MNPSTVPTPIYLTLRLDVLSSVIQELAEASHQARDAVSVRDVRLLLLVREHPGLTMSRLVELSFMEKTMVSKAVTGLTRAGLIERQIGEADARQVMLVLTRKGTGVAERAHRYVIEATGDLMATLSAEQRTVFNDTLGKLTEHVLSLRDNHLDLQARPQALSARPTARARAAVNRQAAAAPRPPRAAPLRSSAKKRP